jgi:predicted amidohydrolase
VFKKKTTAVSLIQTTIKQGEKEANWDGAMALFDQAMAAAPRLVVFPEAFVTGINFIILRQMAEPVPGGDILSRLQALAKQHRIHIAAGILELGEDDRISDCAVLIDHQGALVAKYRRRFRWVGECNYISPGDAPVVVDTDLGRIALLLGYDLCFPEACEGFMACDVDLIVAPSGVFAELNHNTTHLAMARAMEHHCFVAYANALGFHQFANMHYTGGSALCADPYFLQTQMKLDMKTNSAVLASAAREPAVVSAGLPIDDLRAARKKKLPFKGDAARVLERLEGRLVPQVLGAAHVD